MSSNWQTHRGKRHFWEEKRSSSLSSVHACDLAPWDLQGPGFHGPFPLNKPHCLSLYLYSHQAASPGVCFSFFPHGDRLGKPVVFLRGLQCCRGEILCADGQKPWVVWTGEGLLPFSAPELGEQSKITSIFQWLFPLCFVLFAKGDREPHAS